MRRNLPGTCVRSFCSCEMGGVSGPAKGGVSGQPKVHSCYQASGKGRNSTGSSGRNVVFNVPRAETPALVGGDSATRNISGVLKAEVPGWPTGQWSEFGLHVYNHPPSPRRVTLSSGFISCLTFSPLHCCYASVSRSPSLSKNFSIPSGI